MENSKQILQKELAANKNTKELFFQSILTSEEFQNSPFKLPIILGETYERNNFIIDLAELPHFLVLGKTNEENSLFLYAIINSLSLKKSPEELKLVLIDTKHQHFSLYGDLINHFSERPANGESQIISDTQMVVDTLNSQCLEMENRYEILKQNNVLNLKEYNQLGKENLPYVVVIIDEIADFWAIGGKKIEMPIVNLVQLGQAVGIHLVIAIARQNTSFDLINYIVDYIPSWAIFQISRSKYSNTNFDRSGSEQLLEYARGSTQGKVSEIFGFFISTRQNMKSS